MNLCSEVRLDLKARVRARVSFVNANQKKVFGARPLHTKVNARKRSHSQILAASLDSCEPSGRLTLPFPASPPLETMPPTAMVRPERSPFFLSVLHLLKCFLLVGRSTMPCTRVQRSCAKVQCHRHRWQPEVDTSLLRFTNVVSLPGALKLSTRLFSCAQAEVCFLQRASDAFPAGRRCACQEEGLFSTRSPRAPHMLAFDGLCKLALAGMAAQ